MIDLSKLKPRELPTKDISVMVGGEQQTITIHPLNGGGRIAISGLAERIDQKNITFDPTIVRLALVFGADLTEAEAERLIECDTDAAVTIGNAVWILNGEFEDTRAQEKKTAEKNSGTAGMNTEN